jgi:hypothetical protein
MKVNELVAFLTTHLGVVASFYVIDARHGGSIIPSRETRVQATEEGVTIVLTEPWRKGRHVKPDQVITYANQRFYIYFDARHVQQERRSFRPSASFHRAHVELCNSAPAAVLTTDTHASYSSHFEPPPPLSLISAKFEKL